MMGHWSERLEAIGACGEAVAWARTQPSYEAAWEVCGRGDWMLWLEGRLLWRGGHGYGSERSRRLVGAAARCAVEALPIWEARYPQDTRTSDAIALCLRYATGEAVTVAEMRSVGRAAYADDAAARAAETAASAAVAAALADASSAASGGDAAARAARSRSLRRSADIARFLIRRPQLPEPAATGEGEG